jgi:hypothetical protein
VGVDVQDGPGLSPWQPPGENGEASPRSRRDMWLFGMRYVLPVIIGIAGIVVMLAASDTQTGIEVGSMFLGVAIAVFLLNFFFRMGVSGEDERDREERARQYFDKYGRWPD